MVVVRLKKCLALLIASSLLANSWALADGGRPLPVSAEIAPDVLKDFHLPPSLGYVTDQSNFGPTAPVVILIQDLHLHYPTQKRITKILNRIYESGFAKGPIAIEGTSGPYDTSALASLPSGSKKEKLLDYFMSKGELSGDEAFAILRGDANRLIGVDDPQLYGLNRELFRRSFSARKDLEQRLAYIRKEFSVLKRQHYPRALQRNELNDADDVTAAAQRLQERLKVASTLKDQKEKTFLLNLIQADFDLSFLERLVRQETTAQETQYVAQRLESFVALTEKLLASRQSSGAPLNSSALEETLKSSIDFYTVALMRDDPLARNTIQVAKSQSSPLPLIVGGFHTAGLIKTFKEAGVSYVVITPHVDKVAADYHELYERRLNGQRLSLAEVAQDFHTGPTQISLTSNGSSDDTLRLLSSVTSRASIVGRYASSLVFGSLTLNGGIQKEVEVEGLSVWIDEGKPDSVYTEKEPAPEGVVNGAIAVAVRSSLDRLTKRIPYPKLTKRVKFFIAQNEPGNKKINRSRRKNFLHKVDVFLDKVQWDTLVDYEKNGTPSEKKGAKAIEDLILGHEVGHSQSVTSEPFWVTTILGGLFMAWTFVAGRPIPIELAVATAFAITLAYWQKGHDQKDEETQMERDTDWFTTASGDPETEIGIQSIREKSSDIFVDVFEHLARLKKLSEERKRGLTFFRKVVHEEAKKVTKSSFFKFGLFGARTFPAAGNGNGDSGESSLLPLSTDVSALIAKYRDASLSDADADLVRKMVRDYDYRTRETTAPSAKLWFLWGIVWARMALEKDQKFASGRRTVVLGRDTRKIDPALIEALAAGLTYAGLDVIYIGEKPNAASSYATAIGEHQPLMGIFITSSHVSGPPSEQIQGAKVSMYEPDLDNLIGPELSLVSLTTSEIKNKSRGYIERLMRDPSAVSASAATKPGVIKLADPTPINKRWSALVGRIAFLGNDKVNLYKLKREIETRPLREVIDQWEKMVPDVPTMQPLKGMVITVDGSNTPSGRLAEAAFIELGAKVDLINGKVLPLSGEHKADPSKRENLAELKAKMDQTGSLFGLAFDLDGDRVAIIIRGEKNEFIELGPDNVMAALLPFLQGRGGFNSEKTGQKFAIVRDVLSTEGVDDAAAKAGFLSEVTDAGYVFVKAENRQLRKQGIFTVMMGERSGHGWLMGQFENPIEVAVAYAAMARREKDRLGPKSEWAKNPFYEIYMNNTVPYLQATRFAPPFHESFLRVLSKKFGAQEGWHYEPGVNPPQRIIALGRDEAIKRSAAYFYQGRTVPSKVGPLTVKTVRYEDQSAREEDGLYRFADIQFVDGAGVSAGHFVLRASANDPTFVATYESRRRIDFSDKDRNSQLERDKARFQAVGGVVLDFLESQELADITGPQVDDFNTTMEAERSLVPYRALFGTAAAVLIGVVIQRLFNLHHPDLSPVTVAQTAGSTFLYAGIAFGVALNAARKGIRWINQQLSDKAALKTDAQTLTPLLESQPLAPAEPSTVPLTPSRTLADIVFDFFAPGERARTLGRYQHASWQMVASA